MGPADPFVFIGMPIGEGGVHGATVQTILNLTLRLAARGVPGTYRFVPGCTVDEARNELLVDFMHSPATHLLWVDADIAFEPDLVLQMLAVDLDIVLGVYRCRKRPGHEPLCYFTNPPVIRTPNGRSRVLELHSGGIGFCLVKRSVFERLGQRHPELEFDSSHAEGRTGHALFSPAVAEDIEGKRRLHSEDSAFFARCRRSGIPIHALLDAQVWHAGYGLCLGRDVPSLRPGAPASREATLAAENAS